MPIPLISKIKPQNSAPIAMYDDTDGYGGFQVRANQTDRDSIPTACRKAGMLVYTQAEGSFWQLQSNLTTWLPANFTSTGNLTLAGDLSGTFSSQIVVGIQGYPISNSTPLDGYVLVYDATDGYWVARNFTSVPGAGFNGIPSNEYGGSGNKILIPATETILGSGTTYPASSAENGITTSDNSWHTILHRQPLGPGRWQVTVVAQDGLGNEFSAHLDFHANTSSITPSSPQIINPLAVGSGGNFTIQAVFSGGQVLIQVMNASGSNPVKWGAWLQDMSRL